MGSSASSPSDLPTYLIIIATLSGPVLAVQAQKWIERFNERRNRKRHLFQNLMATRGTRLSLEHVQSLNMIDTVFYGSRLFWIHRRTKQEKAVLDAWRVYLDHLNTPAANFGGVDAWAAKGADLFVDLLTVMGHDLGYSFDRVMLNKSWYNPTGHAEVEKETNAVRKLAKQVLGGEIPLKMVVTEFPFDPQAVQAQKTMAEKAGSALDAQKAMGEAIVSLIKGGTALNVSVQEKDSKK